MTDSSASQVTCFNGSVSSACISASTSFHIMHVITLVLFESELPKHLVVAHMALHVMCLCRQPGLLSAGCIPIQPSLIQLRQAQQEQGAHSRHPQARIPQCLQHVIVFIIVSYQFEVFLMLICATRARWPYRVSTGLQYCLGKLVAMHSSRVTYRCSQLLREMGCLRGPSGQAERRLQQLSQWQQHSLLAMPCIYTIHSIESFSTCPPIERFIHSANPCLHMFRITHTVRPELVVRLQTCSNMQHTCGICQAAETWPTMVRDHKSEECQAQRGPPSRP